MSKPTAKELLSKQGYYPCLFYICKHNQMHRHECSQCHKYMLEGEEQVLTAYYNSTYDHVGGPKATLVGYDITCRLCHPGPIDKGFHYGELIIPDECLVDADGCLVDNDGDAETDMEGRAQL